MNEGSEISFEDETSFLDESDVFLNLDVETNIPDDVDVTNDGNLSEKQNVVYTYDACLYRTLKLNLGRHKKAVHLKVRYMQTDHAAPFLT